MQTEPSPTVTSPLSQRLFSGERILLRYDVLWRIERGSVRNVTWNEQGTLQPLGYWGVGDVVGQPLSRFKPYQIECLTDVEVTVLPSALWLEALDAILSHIQQAEELLSIAYQNPLRQRLWQFLVFLAEKFGRDVETGKLIDLAFTHHELAEAINATRVTVTRLLQQFEHEGLLLRRSRRLIVTRH